MTIPVRVDLTVSESVQQFDVTVSENNIPVAITVITPIVASVIQNYDGSYEFTPSADEQTVPTRGKRLTQDITINPIPNNYGLITWNGSIITVS